MFKNKQNKNRINLLRFFNNSLLFVIGLVFVFLGMSMIVMPAPPFFEMYVIFVLSPETGFTLMDLFSLIIVLCGIYLAINSLNNSLNNLLNRKNI